MKRLIPVSLLCLPACTLLGGLSEEDERAMQFHRDNSGRYFNERQFEKSADQALKGLAIAPDDYELKDRLAWSYLQLSAQRRGQNLRQFLRNAERTFDELIRWRAIEDHKPGTVLGYAMTLHNRARVEELDAKIQRDASEKPGGDPAVAARADEHEKRAEHYDRQAERYFKFLVDGDVAGKAHKRESLEYLMALRYRAKDIKGAIAYGNRNLEVTEKEQKFWQAEYARTLVPKYERVVRDAIADLERSSTAVHSRLAAYHRELGQYPDAILHLDAILKANPQRFEDYYLRGICYRSLNQAEMARKDFRRFIELSSLPEGHQAVKDAHQYLYGTGK